MVIRRSTWTVQTAADRCTKRNNKNTIQVVAHKKAAAKMKNRINYLKRKVKKEKALNEAKNRLPLLPTLVREQAYCQKLYNKYQCSQFEWRNQTWTRLVSDLFEVQCGRVHI